AVLGRATPAQGGGSVNTRSRGTGGGTSRLNDEAKGVKDRAKGGHLKSVPQDPPKGTELSKAGYWIGRGGQLVESVGKMGFKLEGEGGKSAKGGGGRFQTEQVTGTYYEWRVTSPSGVTVDIDGLAVDPTQPGGLIVIEAKAAFVVDPSQSAHMRFFPEKVE